MRTSLKKIPEWKIWGTEKHVESIVRVESLVGAHGRGGEKFLTQRLGYKSILLSEALRREVPTKRPRVCSVFMGIKRRRKKW